MMFSLDDLFTLLWLWIAVLGLILLVRWKRDQIGGGLIFAYVINLWIVHWVANALYLVPWYELFNVDIIILGLQQSLYGTLGFAAGSLIVAPLFMPPTVRSDPAENKLEFPRQLPMYYIGFGMLSYILQSSPLGGLPTITALVSVGQNLFILGVCLACWQAWKARRYSVFTWWLCVIAMIPLITILTRGFIGYGVVALLVVIAFITSFVRPRWRIMAIGLVACYFGLSVYVNYMRDRTDIRATVWGGQAYTARIVQLIDTALEFEWFDWENEEHLQHIDLRLNQNFLVGMAVTSLEESGEFAYGETMWQALIAFVPRILWPEKPVYAGSPDLVSQYTGMEFAQGTSVGVGQVMEFYINFGTGGVIIGFIVFGVFITVIDRVAWQALRDGNWQRFSFWYLIGISFLQVGGSLVEIAGSAGASVGVAWLVNTYLTSRFQADQVTTTGLPVSSLES